jgi:hypothetical protein
VRGWGGKEREDPRTRERGRRSLEQKAAREWVQQPGSFPQSVQLVCPGPGSSPGRQRWGTGCSMGEWVRGLEVCHEEWML